MGELSIEEPLIERVAHAPRVRAVTVMSIESVTPGVRRMVLAGEALADFASLGFDDHVKLVVPMPDGTVERRDYTPRRHERLRDGGSRLTLDFALHGTGDAGGTGGAGPATAWAMAARPGDAIEIAGPKKSNLIARACRDWLLVGDETALPAIGRFLEEAEAGTRVTALVAVSGEAEEQRLESPADLTALWVHRRDAADPAALLARLGEVALRPGLFAWIAGEAGVARAVRAALLERGHPLAWMKAGGYWTRGRADTHGSIV